MDRHFHRILPTLDWFFRFDFQPLILIGFTRYSLIDLNLPLDD